MNTSKKINEQFYKYTGVIFSLLLVWILLKHQEDLSAENFLASIMMPILIARELIIMRKSAINRPLLICTLILNLILLIPALEYYIVKKRKLSDILIVGMLLRYLF